MSSEQHRRVLVVDDDADIRKILVTALGQKALMVDEAVDGASAIALLHQHPYAVVLLDLMMPVVNGFAVLDAIKTDLPNPPVVLVVTGASRETIERVDIERIHGVIRKPFDPLEVASIVASCAEVRSRGPFETMAIASMISGGALINWLRGL